MRARHGVGLTLLPPSCGSTRSSRAPGIASGVVVTFGPMNPPTRQPLPPPPLTEEEVRAAYAAATREDGTVDPYVLLANLSFPSGGRIRSDDPMVRFRRG